MSTSSVTRRIASAATLLGHEIFGGSPGAARAAGPLRRLPPARQTIGRPLMQVLSARRSTREYSSRALTDQQLSDLLWAACGVNRPGGDRTMPYWRHLMVVDVYAVMADGVWLYEPGLHALRRHLDADLRALTGTQDFVSTAPLNLVYAVQGERMAGLSHEDRRLFGSVDAAFAGQNVYLYCASEGLGTVFRGAIEVPRLGQAMELPPGHFVVFAQTVGHLPV